MLFKSISNEFWDYFVAGVCETDWSEIIEAGRIWSFWYGSDKGCITFFKHVTRSEKKVELT